MMNCGAPSEDGRTAIKTAAGNTATNTAKAIRLRRSKSGLIKSAFDPSGTNGSFRYSAIIRTRDAAEADLSIGTMSKCSAAIPETTGPTTETNPNITATITPALSQRSCRAVCSASHQTQAQETSLTWEGLKSDLLAGPSGVASRPCGRTRCTVRTVSACRLMRRRPNGS